MLVRAWVVVGGSGRGPSPLLAEVQWVLLVGVGRLWCRGVSSPLLAEGATGVVDGEGGGCDGVVDADAALAAASRPRARADMHQGAPTAINVHVKVR